MEPAGGFEPSTCCLRNSCSTTELHRPDACRRLGIGGPASPRVVSGDAVAARQAATRLLLPAGRAHLITGVSLHLREDVGAQESCGGPPVSLAKTRLPAMSPRQPGPACSGSASCRARCSRSAATNGAAAPSASEARPPASSAAPSMPETIPEVGAPGSPLTSFPRCVTLPREAAREAPDHEQDSLRTVGSSKRDRLCGALCGRDFPYRPGRDRHALRPGDRVVLRRRWQHRGDGRVTPGSGSVLPSVREHASESAQVGRARAKESLDTGVRGRCNVRRLADRLRRPPRQHLIRGGIHKRVCRRSERGPVRLRHRRPVLMGSVLVNGVLVIATSVLALRTAVLPNWLGWVGFAAVVLPLSRRSSSPSLRFRFGSRSSALS